MKTLEDYKREVLGGMAQNQTILCIDNDFYTNPKIPVSEVQEALICRYAEKLNDYLFEPFGRDMICEKDPQNTIQSGIETFVEQIESTCTYLMIDAPKTDIAQQLKSYLDERYRRYIKE